MLKSRLNASTLLAEMFDRKQNILLTKMLNTRHQTWCAKRCNIRAIYTGENKTRLILNKTRADHINGTK